MNQSLQQVIRSRKIPDIEVLRGVAVIFVIIHHINGNLIMQPHALVDLFFKYFHLGIGVDIFFVISGFVIARQLVPGLLACQTTMQRANNILVFWLRRFWRLLPSAWLWLAIIVMVSIFFNRSGAFGSVRSNYEGAVAGLLQVANFRFGLVFERFESGATFVYWSLSLEEQFYLLFPFVILLFRGKLPWALGGIAIVQLFTPHTGPGVFRTDALALGCLIALWQSHFTYELAHPRFMRLSIVRWLVVIILLIIIGSVGSIALHIVPYPFSLVTIIAGMLVFFASYNEGYTVPPAFIAPIMLWVGARSYSLYLIHIPAAFFTREIFYRLAQSGLIDSAEHWVRMASVFGVILIALAEASYRFVEVPCRNYGARLAKSYAKSAISEVAF